jgi:uncharacterized protein YbgA (DUF1722 family)
MKLAQLSGPKLVKTDSYGTASVAFPNGDVYNYHLYDKALLNALVRKHGRNIGRLVAALKASAVETELSRSARF